MISLIRMKILNSRSEEMCSKMKDWNTIDERCPYCNSVIEPAKGINKQNLKKLCWSRPTIQDVIIFIMLILCLIMFWTYNNEIAQYKSMYENPEEFCNSYWNSVPIQGFPYEVEINVSKYKKDGE